MVQSLSPVVPNAQPSPNGVPIRERFCALLNKGDPLDLTHP